MGGLRSDRTIRMVGAAVVVVALVATACGKSGGTGAGEGTATTAGGAATTGGGSSNATLDAKNVSGLGMVLVDSRGFTLYRLTGETTSNIMCTGSCTTTWPPLKASGSPAGGSGATGTIATIKRSDGITQVTYDGVPLYTFAGDSGPGQSNGEGIQGVWFAVTPAGQSAKGGSGGGGASPTGGGYGGY
jgi:predicted lipoprotein with Yx(FWY)xxD motif